MNRELYLFDDRRCYVVRWLVTLTAERLSGHWRDLVDHPQIEPGWAALHDLRQQALDFRSEAMREPAETYRFDVEPSVGFGRAAVLVDSEKTRTAVGRLFALLELDGAIVTESEREAKEWVGLPPDFELPYSSA